MTVTLKGRVKIHGILFTLSGTSPSSRGRNNPMEYYHPGPSVPTLESLAGTPYEVENRINPRVSAALRIVLSNSMRACEYLQLTSADVMTNDRVIVRGAKGSGSYIIHLPDVSRQFRRVPTDLTPRPLGNVTYSQLYKACVICGIGTQYLGHVNMSRTHKARYELVSELKDICDNRVLSDCLHHRKDSTIKYYGAGGF